ncbi:MAG: AAA family ATPase [Elusimicrobiales bacterium]|nr:AAA family ATPase [Elusimicrobiales bacterium]
MTFKERYLQKPFALGTSEFTEIIDDKSYYCDKTLLLKDLIDSKSKVILFTRPRRFGKTLNMTMLRTFFEKPTDGKNTRHYFKNLKIWQAGEQYRAEQGKRPVIYITLKDVKFSSYQDVFFEIKKVIASEFHRHIELEQSVKLDQTYKNFYCAIKNRNAPDGDYTSAIKTLSEMLYKHHGEKSLILIDEYDVPIQAGYESGFYDEIIKFMRNFLSGAFKDNPSLYKGALTGVSRVSKESIFSGLNNLEVNTIFDKTFSTYFGFTQQEIDEMFRFYGIEDKLKEAEDWYDGYIFGEEHIYNPWSIINYLYKGCVPADYWVNITENGLAGDAIRNLNQSDRQNLINLMSGDDTFANVSTNMVYADLDGSIENAYGLLTQAGYLTAMDAVQKNRTYLCKLKIPNRELFSAYSEEVLNRILLKPVSKYADNILSAILLGRAADLQKNLTDFLMETCSCLTLTEEKDYQNIMIGLLASMKRAYDISLEKETGHGRADIIMQPRLDIREKKILPGIIIELKHYSETEKVNPEKIKAALEKQAYEAIKQIETKGYGAKMRSAGVHTVIKYGAAFSGKYVVVKTAC